ncbi:hypothetical protein STIAU_1280, partial [Stigmatella aurantiaca DW4/3-1]
MPAMKAARLASERTRTGNC